MTVSSYRQKGLSKRTYIGDLEDKHRSRKIEGVKGILSKEAASQGRRPTHDGTDTGRKLSPKTSEKR